MATDAQMGKALRIVAEFLTELNSTGMAGVVLDAAQRLEESTDACGIREAPAVTALRQQPRLSDLIDKADDLRKQDKGE